MNNKNKVDGFRGSLSRVLGIGMTLGFWSGGWKEAANRRFFPPGTPQYACHSER